MRWASPLGTGFFAVAVVGLGFMQVVNANFVRLVPPLPGWVPRPSWLAIAVGVILIVLGAALLFRVATRAAAVACGALLLLNFFWLHLPRALGDPFTGFQWTNPAKTLALFGGAILIAAAGAAGGAKAGLAARLVPVAPVLLSVFLVTCGVQHFVYAGFVDSLVPAWIPPGARFWTVATGITLIAGGAGLLIPRVARPAALLSAMMIFLWVLLLHIPRAFFEEAQASELAGVFEALAMSGVALLVAGALPRGK